ncbi:MAG: polyphosphate polymerase domain-containing protein [bacterium]|nr:polyphosphate polymerase domain-containing protein [bacterium]
MVATPDALSSLRSFNRFELKYLIGRDQIGAVRSDLSNNLDPDPHSPDGAYAVWSRYYDTADFKFYWEKIDGIRFRRKLRIRHYGDPTSISDEEPVFVEIKQRVNRVTQKRRVRLPYTAALALCDEHVLPELTQHAERVIAEEVLTLSSGLDLRATTIVGYRRQALVGRRTDGGLRITFDTLIRGRKTDLDLAAGVETPSIVSPQMVIVEVKVNERVPYWLTEKIARHNMQLVRISKYCTSVEGKPPLALRQRVEDTA